MYLSTVHRPVRDRVKEWVHDRLDNPETLIKNYPIYDLLKWTGKGNLPDHLQKLKNNNIINFNNIDDVLNLEEKPRINKNDDSGDYARSIFDYWKDETGEIHVPKRSLNEVIYKIL